MLDKSHCNSFLKNQTLEKISVVYNFGFGYEWKIQMICSLESISTVFDEIFIKIILVVDM
jgi:hypothetical protein